MTKIRDPGKPVRTPRGKGLIRSLNRGFTRTNKRRPVEASAGRPTEPSVCDRCGAVFRARVWRRDRPVSGALLARARWVRCPACEQSTSETGFGRVVIRGAYALAHEPTIRRRLANVASRAAWTQPERRISAVDRHGDVLEIITTSQKLAHRIVHELRKLYRGRASYAWSDDGTLFATWERER
jgi:NMD protein affecting ribosome stability and mRNA decay